MDHRDAGRKLALADHAGGDGPVFCQEVICYKKAGERADFFVNLNDRFLAFERRETLVKWAFWVYTTLIMHVQAWHEE